MTIETNWLLGLHIPAQLMPSFVLWFTTILFVVILLFAAIKVEFRQLLNNKPGQHVYFGAMVMLLLAAIPSMMLNSPRARKRPRIAAMSSMVNEV
jgi:hypothetical protein